MLFQRLTVITGDAAVNGRGTVVDGMPAVFGSDDCEPGGGVAGFAGAKRLAVVESGLVSFEGDSAGVEGTRPVGTGVVGLATEVPAILATGPKFSRLG